MDELRNLIAQYDPYYEMADDGRPCAGVRILTAASGRG